MDWIVLVPGFIVPAVSVLLILQKCQRDADWQQLCAAWKRAAHRLGFHFGPGEKPGLVKMFGKIGDLDVVIDTSNDLRINTPLVEVTRLQVFTNGAIPKNLSIERVQPDGLQIATRWKRIETGDRELDEAIIISGSEPHATALLDHTRRRLLLGWVARSGAVIEGSNVFYVESGHIKDTTVLVDRVERIVRFAKALCMEEASLPERLIANARREKNVFMRRRAFRTLFLEFSETAQARDAVPLALADEDARIRLYAAMAQGMEGLQVIEAIARDTGIALDDRRYAYDHLVRTLPIERARSFVAEALDMERPEIQRTVIRAIRDSRRTELIAPLIATRCSRMDIETAHVMAEALGMLGDPAAEELLIALLAHDDLSLKIRSARALGRVGTVRAVEPLLVSTTLFTPHDLKDAAKTAVKQIQARIADAGAGRLSLIDPSAAQGALSVADEGGALSLAKDAGALSEA